MVRPTITPLEAIIEWHFQVTEQNNHARYGTYDNRHWKQFLPGGVIISPLHPPKAIPKAVFDHAKKIAKA